MYRMCATRFVLFCSNFLSSTLFDVLSFFHDDEEKYAPRNRIQCTFCFRIKVGGHRGRKGRRARFSVRQTKNHVRRLHFFLYTDR